MKVRLKPSCLYDKMTTPYGTVTHEWGEVPEGSHVYSEMEVEEQVAKVAPAPEPEPVVEPVEEPKVEPEVVEPEVVEEPKPFFKHKKKKRR